MRNIVSLVLIISSILAGSAMASSPLVGRKPFDVARDEPTPRPTGPGPVTLTYDIVLDPNHECDEVTIRLHQTERMTLLSPEVTTYPMDGHGPTRVTLDVLIPEDTSGIELFIEGCDLPRTFWGTFFVVEEDTVKIFRGRNPHQLWSERWEREREEARIRNWSKPRDSAWIKSHLLVEPRTTVQLPDGTTYDPDTMTMQQEIDLHSSYGRDGNPREEQVPHESEYDAEHETRRKAREEGLLLARDPEGNLLALPREEQRDSLRIWEIREQTARMREMEKEPLTEQEHQSIIVGEDVYVRQRGQREFRKLERVGSREEAARAIPGLAQEVRGPVEQEYIIDLRDSNDLNLVRQLSDNMSETDSAGFYRVSLSQDAFRKLKARGFVDKWYRLKAWQQLRSGAGSKEKDSASDGGATNQ
jgi:hypothetical protein